MENGIIMLVEDNPDDEELTIRALKKANILNDVVVARDGVEALDYLFGTGAYEGRDLSVMPLLILLDLRMPKIDGLEVLKRIRSDDRTRRLNVVVMTTSKEEADLARSYDLNANSYIRKPVNFDQFTEAVKNIGLYWLVLNVPPPMQKAA